jgi:hypothetical protein
VVFNVDDKLLKRIELVKEYICIHDQIEHLHCRVLKTMPFMRQRRFVRKSTCLHLDILINNLVDMTESGIRQVVHV